MDNISTAENIYFDTANRSKQPLQIFIGGRGCGKTFSTLRNCVYNNETGERIYPPSEYSGKFMYVRHTQKQINICGKNAGNPFKRINNKIGTTIYPRLSDDLCTFYDKDTSDIKNVSKIIGAVPLGYGCALSTFGNMRGTDFSDVDDIIFDEFIEQSNRLKSLTADAGNDFQNLRETVGRNRELEGQEPLRIKLLSNSITLDSPILLELGIANTIAHMIFSEQHRCTIPEKGIYIELIQGGEFEKLKSETTLYKNSNEDSLFVQQSLRNQFFSENFELVRKNAPINEYMPTCTFNRTFTLYKHKSRREWFLSGKSIQHNCPTYKSGDVDKMVNDWGFAYKRWVIDRNVYFDSYATKLVADSLLK